MQREKEANMDTYFVEYMLNGKEYLYTFKSDKSEEAVREYVAKYMQGTVPELFIYRCHFLPSR